MMFDTCMSIYIICSSIAMALAIIVPLGYLLIEKVIKGDKNE